jgi:arsenate reductase
MRKQKVLFVCVHNSARSQMAQELLNRMCGETFEAESAGLEPGNLNPLAVEVLREEGIDITGRETRSVFDVFKSGQMFSYVIAVCDGASAERCPIFPGVTTRLYWNFSAPSTFQGTWEEKLEQTRRVKEEIEAQLEEFCDERCFATAQ